MPEALAEHRSIRSPKIGKIEDRISFSTDTRHMFNLTEIFKKFDTRGQACRCSTDACML